MSAETDNRSSFETLYGTVYSGTPEYDEIVAAMKVAQKNAKPMKPKRQRKPRRLKQSDEPIVPPYFETLEGTFHRGTADYEAIAQAVRQAHEQRQAFKKGRRRKPQRKKNVPLVA